MFDSRITSYDQKINILKDLAYKSLKHWNLQAENILLVKFRENAVFKIITVDDKQYALRVHRGGYHTDIELRSELEWMSTLRNYGIDVPILVQTNHNQLFVKESINGLIQHLQIDLFEWIDGKLLGSAENGFGEGPDEIKDTYKIIGNIAARLHNQSTSWNIPQDFYRHKWDVDGLVGEQPLWGRFWELDLLSNSQRELIIKAKGIVKKNLTELSLNSNFEDHFSLIHADFVPENLMVVDEKVQLLDFDDAGFGWHLFEIATALYFIQNESHYEIAKDALIKGYREFRSLGDDMLSKLPIFMMARGFTYLGWLHTRSDSKDGEELAPILIDLACTLAKSFISEYEDVIEKY